MKNIRENFTDYLKKKYENLELENINKCSNIKRHTKPIMAEYVENSIAILLNDILGKKYNYIIDPQISVDDKKIVRPDIIICDKNNIIHGIIEVKANLGYSKITPEKYNKKNNKIKEASNNNILKINNKTSGDDLAKEKVPMKVSEDCIDCVVILTDQNDHGNLKNLEEQKDINYFVLFKGEKIWYNNIDATKLNKDKDGFESFVEFISRIKN